MKNSIVRLVLGSMIGVSMLVSCSKDDDSPKGSDSRKVKYEITGTATGTFDFSYITASGAATNEQPTSIPWSKEIVIQAGVTGVYFNSSVFSATPGKTITSKIYVGGVEKKSETATVQPDGTAIIAGLAYVF